MVREEHISGIFSYKESYAMMETKITPLYERLSHDDELLGESNSVKKV